MKDNLRIGIIGAGHMGRSHFENYQNIERCEVVAFAEINEATAAAYQDYTGVTKCYTDYREMLEKAGLDAVSVCLPPFLHSGPTIDALEAGFHVLCEKPMATTVKEAAAMVAAQEKSGKVLAICSGRHKAMHSETKAREMVKSGKLGEVYYLTTNYIRRRGAPGLDILAEVSWFTDPKKSGGGAITDLACYFIDLGLWLVGDPDVATVSAFTFSGIERSLPEKNVKLDVEEHATVMIRTVNGPALLYQVTFAINNEESNDIRIYGSKQGIKLSPFTVYRETNGELEDLTIRGKDTSPGWGDSVIGNFVDAVLDGAKPLTDGRNGLLVTQVIAAAYESARLGKEVQFSEFIKQQ